MNDFEQEVERVYDEYLIKTENRGIRYGEIVYIQELSETELNDLYKEIIVELEKRSDKNE